MRVAVLSPIAWRTPPRHYGPWEQFASLLTEGLVAAGHDVTLFATADSITAARLHATAPCGWSEDATIDAKVAECLHIASVFERAGEFDIIHNGFDFLPLTYSDLVVHTGGHHDPRVLVRSDHSCLRALRQRPRAYVSISDADRHPDLHYAATIHHGIDIDRFAVHPSPGEHLLFFGRIHPDKGTAARDRGRPPMRPSARHRRESSRTRSTSDDEVAPHVDGDRVRYLGRRRRLCACRGAGGGARATPPDRLRRAVRLQRRRGDGLWHAGHCQLERLDGRADSRTASPAFSSTTSIRRWPRSLLRASSTAARSPQLAAERFTVSAMVDKYVKVYRDVIDSLG